MIDILRSSAMWYVAVVTLLLFVGWWSYSNVTSPMVFTKNTYTKIMSVVFAVFFVGCILAVLGTLIYYKI